MEKNLLHKKSGVVAPESWWQSFITTGTAWGFSMGDLVRVEEIDGTWEEVE